MLAANAATAIESESVKTEIWLGGTDKSPERREPRSARDRLTAKARTARLARSGAGQGAPREDRAGVLGAQPLSNLAGRQGFEPRLHGPEPRVLPLNDLPAWIGRSSAATFNYIDTAHLAARAAA